MMFSSGTEGQCGAACPAQLCCNGCVGLMRAISSAQCLPFKGVLVSSRWDDCICNCMSLKDPDLRIDVQNWEELSCDRV